jgi:hypothetical protein
MDTATLKEPVVSDRASILSFMDSLTSVLFYMDGTLRPAFDLEP